jgi:uncharacterized protein
MLKTSFRALALLLPLLLCAAQPSPAAEPHKLALQISDNDADKMNTVLNVAANVSHYYSDKGEEVEIEIVAFNAGLHMLREDTSPVKARLKSFAEGMPNVSFRACQNTLDGMAKREGKVPPIVANASMVPAGVVTLIELGEKGWTIVRP